MIYSGDHAVDLAEAVMRDLDCADVFGHRDELTDSIRRHLSTPKRSGAEPSGVTPVRAADGPGATSSDGGSPETERATSNVDSSDRIYLLRHSLARALAQVGIVESDWAEQYTLDYRTTDNLIHELAGRGLVLSQSSLDGTLALALRDWMDAAGDDQQSQDDLRDAADPWLADRAERGMRPA